MADQSFELPFRQLLEKSRELPDLLHDAIEATPWGSFPGGTVVRLHMLSVTQVHALVAVLGDERSSLAAPSLMRGLIEGWSHLWHIAGRKPADADGAACRAIALEVGMTRELRDAALTDPNMPTQQIEIIQRRVSQIETIQREHGCKGPNVRRYSNVPETLKAIRRAESTADWVEPMYRISSVTLHMAAPDWLLRPAYSGALVAEFPRPSQRAEWLEHSIVLYAEFGKSACRCLEKPPDQHFLEAAQKLVNNPILSRAKARAFDE